MSSLSIDEKLLLVQKMRSQSEDLLRHNSNKYANNSYKYESFPYITASKYSENHVRSSAIADTSGTIEQDLATTNNIRFLKYRIWICLLVFTVFFALYKTNFEIKGHKVTDINSALEENILPDKLQNSLETLSRQIIERY